MEDAKPSRTAFRVALRRAAHQILDSPLVLDDPLAIRLAGAEDATALAREDGRYGARMARTLRAFIVARSRYAEDELARAVARGTRQYVVLGAGLDTFAYRHDTGASGLCVFEVDHPSTQAWKRERLAAAGINPPASLTFVAIDFEHQTLGDALARAGFDRSSSAFFSWLGVVPYLPEDAVLTTLAYLASLPEGGGVVFDFSVPRASLGLLERIAFDALARRVAAAGEPFRSSYEPDWLAARIRAMGFREVDCLDSEAINARYFAHRTDQLKVDGKIGRLMGVVR